MLMEARHGGAASKIHAATHGVRSECFTWAEVQVLLSMYFALAIDPGPEKGILQNAFRAQ